ncbi:MAG: dipeptidase [Myxococcota bacterium]
MKRSRLVALLVLVGACGSERADTPAVEESPPRAAPESADPVSADPVSADPVSPAPEAIDESEDVEAPEEADLPIALDTHVDTTQRMLDEGDDPIARLEGGHLDVPRMREGGLTGAFFSIYVSPRRFEGEAAWQRALALTERVRSFAAAHPDEVALCTSAAEVRRAASERKIAVLMGVEGAHALGTDEPRLALDRIRRLYELGNRYMTLTWSIDSPLGHSSLGEHPDEGLTPLGARAIALMNRLGMIVDISHVSDRTFWEAMERTRRPVLASHSSARSLADIPRNMTDAMIRRVAANGGAVCVNYFTQFIDRDYRLRRKRLSWRERARFEPLQDAYTNWVDRGAAAMRLAMEIDPQIAPPTLDTLADHFEHMVRIAGPEGVCLGSDFDGVPELPLGMRDVRDLAALREVLEGRGLPIRPIFGENVLRVLAAQEGPLAPQARDSVE